MTLKGRRVLLTGGAGFIGTALARQLADANDVVLFDNMTRDAFRSSELGAHENIQLVVGDVLERDAVRRAAEGANIIVHLAAIAGVDAVLASPVRTMRVNLLGTANVVDVANEISSTLEQLVDFSTSEVFGRHAYRVEETHEMSGGSVGEARWTYAVSKLAGEYLSHAYHDEYGLPVTVIRPFNVFGPNQVGVGAIHHFVVRGLRGQDLVVHGDGAQIRAWCYIDDLVSAVLASLETPAAVGEAFNIGNPRSVCTSFDLAQRIRRITGARSEIVFAPITYRDVEIRIPNVDKARAVLEWEPHVDLDVGLERTVDWYRARLAVPS
jgi:nucleoside-diphosphate-sugar epimerase